MAYRAVTHIALNVASLDDAEAYYCELFAMDVALREEIVMLSRDGFSLALEPSDRDDLAARGPLAHVGLYVDEAEIERLERAASGLGCKTARVRPDLLLVWDRYGLQWEITTIWPPRQVARGQ